MERERPDIQERLRVIFMLIVLALTWILLVFLLRLTDI